jgi:hypothetical protein
MHPNFLLDTCYFDDVTESRYLALVAAASKAYGKNTRFFLACGPMSSDYCTEVNWVIKQTAALGIQAYLLDQVRVFHIPFVSS